MEKYIPQPIDTSSIELPDNLKPLLEAMAKNVHEIWDARAHQSRLDWTSGDKHDDENKHNLCLVPYEELPESEKEYDCNTLVETLKLIMKLEFEISHQ